MKLKEIINELEKIYPLSNKEIWDPSGYSVKTQQHKKITGILFAIDLTNDVLKFAIEKKCNLILTHHPFLFEKDKKTEFLKAPYKKEIISKLREHQITSYSMHTNYDCSPLGTSYQIVKYIGLEEYFDYTSPKYSAIINKKTSLKEIILLLKQKLGLHSFRTNIDKKNYDKVFTNIAFLSGSGYIGQIIEMKEKIDLFITSDLKWSDWITYKNTNVNILEIPHLDEEVFAYHLHEIVRTKFNKINNLHIYKMELPYKNVLEEK
ncbi:Nif3-like dinuclear metal center hexameric protein [Mycoplasma sp. CSL7503-lung]|uniref:Nif3-like dinuclear metal center hexameric protein n=1 Tax=Mycoplasma sp. CSL7503-lung TaxID=536372 RepID=UPI0021CE8EA2|nr:Nif3-like dinuclear metal center hexameric protein [Mycoplasma sp. CSL7503-lung]MCU4706830.1 Nif3-like dinuclear metal center hexameric protein [Mycoplasma sp. CSL7503-lung]